MKKIKLSGADVFLSVSSLLIPLIPIFFLYSKNWMEGIRLNYTIYIGLCLAAIGLLLYLALRTASQNPGFALVTMVLFWIAFWTFVPLNRLLARGNSNFPMIMTSIIVLIAVVAIAYALTILPKRSFAYNVVAGLICLLFLFNSVPSLMPTIRGITGEVKDTDDESAVGNYSPRLDWTVDTTLEHSNVYYFLLDGMVGFDAMEKYFGDDQVELKKRLQTLGFVINESASFNGGGTRFSVPALTQPNFYDTVWRGVLNKASDKVWWDKMSLVENFYAPQTGLPSPVFSDAFKPHNETFEAFIDAGYRQATIINEGCTLYPLDYYYYYGNIAGDMRLIDEEDAEHVGEYNAALDLYSNSSVLALFKSDLTAKVGKPLKNWQNEIDKLDLDPDMYDYPGRFIVSFLDALNGSVGEPRFVFCDSWFAHAFSDIDYTDNEYLFIVDEETGEIIQPIPSDIHNFIKYYPPQHRFSINLTLKLVDYVLQSDPDAVIVLQADHGIHVWTEQALAESGLNYSQALEINYSTFSAVRIPPQYGALTQPLDPLDITRWLVNHFVGAENYEYLYYKGDR
ncbi:MAG: hypothetical protein LBL96_09825 [Clostridiales bacterium]|jgi:hypothetical protein|nr:hypothetical protein [Clostridiales bacterium]